MRAMVTGATAPLGKAIVDRLLADPDVTLVLAVGRERDTPTLDPRVLYRGTDLTRTREIHDLVAGLAREHRIEAS